MALRSLSIGILILNLPNAHMILSPTTTFYCARERSNTKCPLGGKKETALSYPLPPSAIDTSNPVGRHVHPLRVATTVIINDNRIFL